MLTATGLIGALLIFAGTPTLFSEERNKLGLITHELFLARAAAKKIVGKEALVAAQHPAWFVSGAATWVDLTKDILWELPREPLKTYFSHFDSVCYLAASWMGTQTGWNEARLLKEGLLHFQGFYKTKNSINRGGYIFLSPKKPAKILGFYWKENLLKSFQQDSGGEYQFSILTNIPEKNLNKYLEMQNNHDVEMVNFMYMPEASPEKRDVIVTILEKTKSEKDWTHAEESEIIFGHIKTEDPNALLMENNNDKKIYFTQTQAEAVVSRIQKADQTQKKVYIDFSLDNINIINNETKLLSKEGMYDKIATSNILSLDQNKYYLIEGQLKILQGGACLHVNEVGTDKPFLSLKRGVPQKETQEKFVIWSGESGKVQITASCHNHFKSKKTIVELKDFTASQM